MWKLFLSPRSQIIWSLKFPHHSLFFLFSLVVFLLCRPLLKPRLVSGELRLRKGKWGTAMWHDTGHIWTRMRVVWNVHVLLPLAASLMWGSVLLTQSYDSLQSSSSESSWISSPDHAAGSSSSSHCGVDVIGPHGGPGPCSPHSASNQSDPLDLLSYQHINSVLREAHFHSLQSRTQSKHRWLSGTPQRPLEDRVKLLHLHPHSNLLLLSRYLC